jgi:hypothetical protein
MFKIHRGGEIGQSGYLRGEVVKHDYSIIDILNTNPSFLEGKIFEVQYN